MIGKQVQNYEIKSHLGEGGMGTVFRASDSILNRDVALKMLHAPLLQQPQFLERFKKEARVLAQLLHPNIAVIYNMIEQDNNHFMVMEYVEGKNLDALLKQYKTLSYKVVVPVIIQALEGLGHAHRKGIFHRDIKPSNLILKSDGTVKLMDFGIAMVAGEQRLTQVNRVVGTVEYIAPEIIQGKEPSVATDLYAMGVTMYELLTGKLPFEGNSDFNLMQDILKKKPLDPNKLNGAVPKPLSDIVMKALEKKPGDRFADARQLQQALINAFPDLRAVELTEGYVAAAAQYVSSPSIAIKRTTPQPTQIFPGDSASTSSSFLGKVKQKILARENRVIVICAAVVLVTAAMAFIFMPRGSSENEKTDNSVATQSQQEKVVPLNKSGDNVQKSLSADTTQALQTIPVTNPTPILVPDEPKKEVTKKKKEPEKENKEQKKTSEKKDEGEQNKADQGERGDGGADKGAENKDTGDKGDADKGAAKRDEGQKDVKEKKPKTLTWDELFGKKKKDSNDKRTNKKFRFNLKKN